MLRAQDRVPGKSVSLKTKMAVVLGRTQCTFEHPTLRSGHHHHCGRHPGEKTFRIGQSGKRVGADALVLVHRA